MAETVRRRLRAATTVALGFAVLALGGCGAEPDDEQRARSAVEALYGAVAAGDGEKACRQLTQSTAETLEDEEKAPCAEVAGSVDHRPQLLQRAALRAPPGRALLPAVPG